MLATLLGLHWRERTGEGQFVAASLLGASVLTISETMKLADGSLADYLRLDCDQTGVGPGRRIVEVADGWIALDAVTDAQLEALDAVELAGRKADEVLRELADRGVPSTRVRLDQMDAFFDDPATWSAGLAARYAHPVWGTVEQIGSMWSLGDLSARFERSSPTIGQHTVEILAELGFDGPAIDALLASGAVTDRETG
jgi:crotonobetainyl-CoA:carnitine CoA-transferase CaiB-like acyl-CoA transferase